MSIRLLGHQTIIRNNPAMYENACRKTIGSFSFGSLKMCIHPFQIVSSQKTSCSKRKVIGNLGCGVQGLGLWGISLGVELKVGEASQHPLSIHHSPSFFEV